MLWRIVACSLIAIGTTLVAIAAGSMAGLDGFYIAISAPFAGLAAALISVWVAGR